MYSTAEASKHGLAAEHKTQTAIPGLDHLLGCSDAIV
jgi:hypothetical protein